MKKTLFLLVALALFGCEELLPEKRNDPPSCRFPFVMDDYEHYGLQDTCVIMNGVTEIKTYKMVYYYLVDSFAHCQPNQFVEFCE